MSETSRARTARRHAAPAERRSGYHHGNLRHAVLAEAMKLLEKHGAADLSLRLVSRQLGVSQQAPFYHFPDKNALLASLAAEGFRRSATALRSRSVKDYTLEQRVRRLCSGYVRMAKEAPQLFRLMFGTQLSRKSEYPELVEAATASFEALVANVEQILVDFSICHCDVKDTTLAIWSLNHGLASLVIDRQSSPMVADMIGDGQVVIEQVTRVLVLGLEPQVQAKQNEAHAWSGGI